MEQYLIRRLMQPPAVADGCEVLMRQPASGTAVYALFRRANGELYQQPLGNDVASKADGGAQLLGYLWLAAASGDGKGACVFIGHQPQMVINGLTPPLPAMTLEPGALLSFRGGFWQVAVRWTPEVSEPPNQLRQKPCPICGCPLEAAPVVQCLCGRWTHLQNPELPDDPDALNCFLHAEKCQCQRTSSLTPHTEPELPASLVTQDSWAEW
jgi:hypothetical protein